MSSTSGSSAPLGDLAVSEGAPPADRSDLRSSLEPGPADHRHGRVADRRSSPDKAFFTNLDTQSVFPVQFNPKELQLDDSAVWNPSEALEQTHPRLAYQRGEPAVLSMELVFDSTDSGQNVHQSYVQPLREFLTADVKVDGGLGIVGRRPPYVGFTWGPFELAGVVEKVGATYLMFASDGTPLRARVTVSLKQAERPKPLAEAGRELLGALGPLLGTLSQELATYTTRSGDTLSGVAAACGVGERLIAVANGIDDPTALQAGVSLLIPSSEEQAEALGAQRRRAAPGNWGALDPGPGAPW